MSYTCFYSSLIDVYENKISLDKDYYFIRSKQNKDKAERYSCFNANSNTRFDNDICFDFGEIDKKINMENSSLIKFKKGNNVICFDKDLLANNEASKELLNKIDL